MYIKFIKGGQVVEVNIWMIVIGILVVVAGILVGLFFAGKKAQKKLNDQQAMLNQYKQTVNMFIIDKKKDKINAKHFPQMVVNQFPKYYKWRKFPLVKAKVENKIMTFISDPKVFDKLEKNKRLKVEISGLYIVGIKHGK